MNKYWKLTKALSNSENERVVELFLSHLKFANLSEATIIRYRHQLEFFFCDIEDLYSSIEPPQILEWLHRKKSHLKESSLKTFLSTLSSFYNFCVRESLIERSPIKKRWFPRLPQPLPKYLEREEVAKIRLACEEFSLQDQTIIEFMLSSGCRVGEIHRLSYGDVNLENRTARVLGKGKKYRTIHFSDKCAVLLETYLNTRHMLSPSSPVFISKKKEMRLSIQGFQTMLNKLGKKAGLTSSLHAHRCRHTFATDLLCKGADLSFISEELGHASLSTTQIYARIPNQQILSQYRKFMG